MYKNIALFIYIKVFVVFCIIKLTTNYLRENLISRLFTLIKFIKMEIIVYFYNYIN